MSPTGRACAWPRTGSRCSASPRRRRRGGSIRRRVVVYSAADCSLCARVLEVVEAVRAELDFELVLVDIGGRADLEARYRDLLPVVEIDGALAFTYFVDPGALRDRLLS